MRVRPSAETCRCSGKPPLDVKDRSMLFFGTSSSIVAAWTRLHGGASPRRRPSERSASLPTRRRFGRPPRISDSELICLAVAQVLLDCPNETRFLRLARGRLGHLFPYIPGQSGFNKRLRSLAPQLLAAVSLLARLSPSFCDRLRLLDSTPVPCGASRETVRRSALAGIGGYGYCRSHSRWFWGFRLRKCSVYVRRFLRFGGAGAPSGGSSWSCSVVVLVCDGS